MTRITNKHKRNATGEWAKHPRPAMKKLGNARLRASPLQENEISSPKTSKKVLKFKQAKLCPFCLSHIPSQYNGEQFKQYGTCKKCSAVKQGKCLCSKCKSPNIWKRLSEFICKRCGLRWADET